MKQLMGITIALLTCVAGSSTAARPDARQDQSPSEEKIYTGDEVTVKAKIISRGAPSYTEEARQHRITGTVILTAVFHSSGEVRDIVVVKGLPYGLTEACVKVTQQIRFEPAMKDGRKVSQRFQSEYIFTRY